MADKEHLLDVAAERALLGLLVAVAVYFLLSEAIGPEWAWFIVRTGILFALLFAGISAAWSAIERRVHNAELRKRELKARDKEIERMGKENERLRFVTRESMGNFLAVDVRSGETSAWFRPVAPHRLTVNQASGGADAAGIGMDTAPPLLDLIGDIERGLICGGTRCGKTFLAKHLAARKISEGGKVIAIDPKHQTEAEPWPPGAVVAGAGFDTEAILRTFDAIDAEADRRGRDLDNIGAYPPVFVFVDEVNALVFQEPEIGPRYVHVLRVYGQYRIGIFALGQSSNAEAVGLRGAADLKLCFDAVISARKDRRAGKHTTWVDFQDGQPAVECIPPSTPLVSLAGCHGHGDHGSGGPFSGSGAWQDDRDGRDSRDHLRLNHDPNAGPSWAFYEEPRPRRFFESRQEKDAVEMSEKGLSLNAIARHLWGAANGRRTKAIKRMLKRHNL